MKITKSHIHFALVWIKRLLIKKDFTEIEKYTEKFNRNIENVLYPIFPEPIWNEILHYFFMMELGATLKSEGVIIENNNEVTKMIARYDELCMWKNRLSTGGDMGTLNVLPHDVLWNISKML